MRTCIDSSTNELTLIHQKLNEQSQKLNEQSHELNELRETVARIRDNGSGSHNGNGDSFLEAAKSGALTDRRGMLKKVAGLAVGVATVGLLRPSSSATNGRPDSPGATGGNMIIGQGNEPTNLNDVTSLFNPCCNLFTTVWEVANFGTTAFVMPFNSYAAMVAYTNNQNAMPTSGNFYGLYAQANTPAGGTSAGVLGIGDNYGVRGRAGAGVGVEGVSTGVGGCGVSAICKASGGCALSAIGDVGLFIEGESITIQFSPAGSVTYPPTGGAFNVTGDLVVSADNTMWYAIASGMPATFRRLVGPALSASDLGTAGALSLLTAPKRLVDTRPGSGFFDQGNPFTNDTLRTYNIITLAAGAVPQKATAIVGRLTVVGATASGSLQESPNPPPGSGNDLGQGTAVLNFPTASVLGAFGATFISALSSGSIRVRGFMAGGGTVNVLLDIVGFYI